MRRLFENAKSWGRPKHTTHTILTHNIQHTQTHVIHTTHTRARVHTRAHTHTHARARTTRKHRHARPCTHTHTHTHVRTHTSPTHSCTHAPTHPRTRAYTRARICLMHAFGRTDRTCVTHRRAFGRPDQTRAWLTRARSVAPTERAPVPKVHAQSNPSMSRHARTHTRT